MSDRKKTMYDIIKEFAGIPDENGEAVMVQLETGVAGMLMEIAKRMSAKKLDELREIAKREGEFANYMLYADISNIVKCFLEDDAGKICDHLGEDDMLPINFIGGFMGAAIAANLKHNPILEREKRAIEIEDIGPLFF